MIRKKKITKTKVNRKGLLIRPGGGSKKQARENAKRKREMAKYKKRQARVSKRVSYKNPSGKTAIGRVLKKVGTKFEKIIAKIKKGKGYGHQRR